MFFGDGVLEIENAPGALVGIGKAGQLQHRGDVRQVLRAQISHVLRVGQIIFTIRKLQPALHQVSGVMVRIAESRRNPQAEKVCGVEIRVVEGVDVRAQRFSKGAG